jgi:hypothetical protein
MAGPVIATAEPHELFIAGGVGTACASAIQATVDPPSTGKTNVGGVIVYVYVHVAVMPEQSV